MLYGLATVYVNINNTVNTEKIAVAQLIRSDSGKAVFYVVGEPVAEIPVGEPSLPSWVWGTAPTEVKLLWALFHEIDKTINDGCAVVPFCMLPIV